MSLITIEEHNKRVQENYKDNTGVACPQCENELKFYDSTVMLSIPPQKKVVCFECGFTTNIFVQKGYF